MNKLKGTVQIKTNIDTKILIRKNGRCVGEACFKSLCIPKLSISKIAELIL